MGIDITLETENGEIIVQLDDSNNHMRTIIESNSTGHSACLAFIDPYGDTTFNQIQALILKAELQNVSRNKLTEEISNFLDKLVLLCDKCIDDVHTYIKFYGD